jgi:hypothetical protein
MLHQLASEHCHLAQPLFDFEQHLAVTAAFAGEASAELLAFWRMAQCLDTCWQRLCR